MPDRQKTIKELDRIVSVLFDALKILQEEQEQPKVGKWIRHGEPPCYVVECSLCGQKFFNHVNQPFAKYCSECGAKMESWMVENQTEVT